MARKVLSAAEAVALIRSRDTITTSGFVGIGVHLDLADRIQRDDAENRLYINLEKLRIRSRDDVARIGERVAELCRDQARPVDVIVNYDGTRVDEDVEGAWAELVHGLEARFYGTVTRYSSSAFTRTKLGRTLRSPHLFETAVDARAFLEAQRR